MFFITNKCVMSRLEEATVERYGYRAFGLNVVSEIPFPGLTPMFSEDCPADVVIEIGDLTAQWSEWCTPNANVVIQDHFVMFQFPNTATYLVTEGKRIVVSPMSGSCQEKLRLYLDGYCMAIILLQRNVLPLHGTAIAIDGKAYAIIGYSGAGKSTLAKAFLDRGYAFLADDVVPLYLTADTHSAMVMPALPEQKLWEESLDQLGMEKRGWRPIYEKNVTKDHGLTKRRTKFAIPVAQFADKPLPLGGIFELVKTEKQEGARLTLMLKMERLRSIMHHTFHRSLISSLNLMEWHLKATARIVNHTDLFKLERSTSCFSAPELVSVIVDQVQKEYLDERQYST